MNTDVQKQTYTNDVFISYSRKDKEFARKLEKALEAYKPPKDLKVPQRNLAVFRDEEDITGVEYHKSIEKHLKDSKKLIVICSPNARKSDFVNDEIRLFAKLHGAQNIIPILLSGIPNNEAKPEQEDEKAFPKAICEVMQMPLATSYLGFDARKDKINKGAFSGSWYTILANIYDASRSEIEQREKKKQAHRRNIWFGTAIVALIILSGLSAWALYSRKEAVKQKNIAEDRLANNYWSNAVDARKNNQWLQAAHFLARFREIETKTQLIRNCIFTMQEYMKKLFLGFQIRHEGSVSGVIFSKDESLILTWSGDGTARLWHTKDGSPATPQPMKHDKILREDIYSRGDSVSGATFSKDASLILTWGHDRTVLLWHIQADYDFPKEHLPILVEVVTGTAMDDLGNVTALNPEKWLERKKQYIEIAEKHLQTCQYKHANTKRRIFM